jgi:uncharacterized protein (TIGR03066 family)
MNTRHFIYAISFLFLLACNTNSSKIELKKIYGTWIKINDSEVDNLGQNEEVTITENGKYKVTTSNKDSIINSFEGTFELDTAKKVINMTNDGYTLKDMTVIKLTDTEMSSEVSEEGEGNYILNYRKK